MLRAWSIYIHGEYHVGAKSLSSRVSGDLAAMAKTALERLGQVEVMTSKEAELISQLEVLYEELHVGMRCICVCAQDVL